MPTVGRGILFTRFWSQIGLFALLSSSADFAIEIHFGREKFKQVNAPIVYTSQSIQSRKSETTNVVAPCVMRTRYAQS